MAIAFSQSEPGDGRFVSPPRDQLHLLRTPLNEGEWRVLGFASSRKPLKTQW